MSDFNTQIIDEFRGNGGRVGGPFQGAPMLLLHTTGAKSGQERINPLIYQSLDGEAVAVFASNAGRDSHPHWYHNLLASPETTVEIGMEVRAVRARVAEGEEREQIWERQKQDRPQFAAYETGTDRRIPVMILEPED
jgi:deazaflavin-dependent oxidoreductase (nitroreductase family)